MTPEHKAKLKAARAARHKGNGANLYIMVKGFCEEQVETVRRAPPTCRGILIASFKGKSKAAAIKAK